MVVTMVLQKNTAPVKSQTDITSSLKFVKLSAPSLAAAIAALTISLVAVSLVEILYFDKTFKKLFRFFVF